ncbi:MAG: hypothetical protein KC636_25415 [Myxococcales bacterium]|nr:hypothetical protein [Myxococcales bacterium]
MSGRRARGDLRRRRSSLRWALALALAGGIACKGKRPPAEVAGQAATVGSWDAWRDLSPLVETAKTHAPPVVTKALEEASAMLRDRKALSAYKRLNALAASEGRDWIAVARGDVASLYFTVCVRGIAWRLEDAQGDAPPTRRADFSEDTPVKPGDISVEALLTDIDAAAASKIPALATQARIARARVAAYVARCPANEQVAEMSEGVLKSDLATLAAEGSLTADLAYMWAGIQFAEYSGAAAKPFLLQAREAGYDDPSVVYLLAVIALEQLELDRAAEYAQEAMAAYEQLGDDAQRAQVHFIEGEIARARKQPKVAREHYVKAQALIPGHVAAMVGEVALVLEGRGETPAIELMHKKLDALVPVALTDGQAAVQNLEALVLLITEPALVAVCRAALLDAVEDDPSPLRRGLRYFYTATLDARLAEYQHAQGHAILARDEFETLEEGAPLVDQVNAFLQQLGGG